MHVNTAGEQIKTGAGVHIEDTRATSLGIANSEDFLTAVLGILTDVALDSFFLSR